MDLALESNCYFNSQSQGQKPFEYIQDESIIIADQRVSVECPETHPFSSICKLQITFKDGTTGGGNAFKISQQLAITSAHNLKYTQKDTMSIKSAENIILTSFLGQKQYAIFQASEYAISSKYDSFGQASLYDIAILYLEKATPSQPHQLGFLQIYENYPLKPQQKAMISSYTFQSKSLYNKQIVQRRDSIIIQGLQIRHKISTTFGQSGSPILVKTEGDQYKVIGIQKGNRQSEGFNVGVFFGAQIMNQLNFLIQKINKRLKLKLNQKQTYYQSLQRRSQEILKLHHKMSINDQKVENIFSHNNQMSMSSIQTHFQADSDSLSIKNTPVQNKQQKIQGVVIEKLYCTIFGFKIGR